MLTPVATPEEKFRAEMNAINEELRSPCYQEWLALEGKKEARARARFGDVILRILGEKPSWRGWWVPKEHKAPLTAEEFGTRGFFEAQPFARYKECQLP